MSPLPDPPDDAWQILAFHYGENAARRRRDSFALASRPDDPHPMDFYFWVLRRGEDVIVVDTGMDHEEAARRQRAIRQEPAEMLLAGGIDPAAVRTVVITHLHFDHAGCLDAFPNATFHIQAEELRVATGPLMANPVLGMPYSTAHVMRMVELVHGRRAMVHDGEAVIADGVTGHLVGGHARGLMGLIVSTPRGPLVLASDVAHFYEQLTASALFNIVIDPEAMVAGYTWALAHGGTLDRILPAHDPLIRRAYPQVAPNVFDLSAAPFFPIETQVEAP